MREIVTIILDRVRDAAGDEVTDGDDAGRNLTLRPALPDKGRIVLDVGDLTESEIDLSRETEIPQRYRWSTKMPVIRGGDIVADALTVFADALADPDIMIMAVPVLDRQRVTIFRKRPNGILREDYGLDDAVQLAVGMTVRARDLIEDGD
jgi:hypothetical protein